MEKVIVLALVIIVLGGIGAAKKADNSEISHNENLVEQIRDTQYDEFDSEDKMQEKVDASDPSFELGKSNRLAGLENAKAKLKGGAIAQTVIGSLIDNSKNTDEMPYNRPNVDEIRDEDDITFERREGRKGMNAVDVRRTD